MRSFFLLLMLLPLFLFSQESELVSNTSEGFKGISIGLLFEAQTKYPNPYYGPNVGGLFDDGSYHLQLMFIIKNSFLVFNYQMNFYTLQSFLKDIFAFKITLGSLTLRTLKSVN